MKAGIRVGVIGAGPMGRLHAQTISRHAKQDPNCVLTVIVDRNLGRAEALASELNAIPSNALEEVVSGLDAAVVAVPTSSHFSLTEYLLDRGVDVLVEKPLAGTLAEAESLVKRAREQKCILQVGHVEWYNRGWREAARLAGSPRSIEVERLNPPSERGLDIDVVQDFMLHDLDWVTRLIDEDVVELEARGRCIRNDKLDEAEAWLRFSSGCQVKLRASRVNTLRRRVVRIEGDQGNATGDLALSLCRGRRPEHRVEASTRMCRKTLWLRSGAIL